MLLLCVQFVPVWIHMCVHIVFTYSVPWAYIMYIYCVCSVQVSMYISFVCVCVQGGTAQSALTLSNVAGIFYILIIGLVGSLVIALLEYFYKTRRKTQQQRVTVCMCVCTCVGVCMCDTMCEGFSVFEHVYVCDWCMHK